jgi:hypothetical protein
MCYLVHKVPDGRWELWPREAESREGLGPRASLPDYPVDGTKKNKKK